MPAPNHRTTVYSQTTQAVKLIFHFQGCCVKARQVRLTAGMQTRAKKPSPTKQTQCINATIHADICRHRLLSCLCRKHAKKSRDAREQRRDSLNQQEMATGDAGLFSLINSQLGDRPRPHQPHLQAASHSDTYPSSLHTSTRQSKFADSQKVAAAPRPPDRKALIAHQVSCWAVKQRHMLTCYGKFNCDRQPFYHPRCPSNCYESCATGVENSMSGDPKKS